MKDCSALQSDVAELSAWCSKNRLILNLAKTKVMSYTRKTHRLLFSYSIEGAPLHRVEEIKDLGVVFDSTLSFSPHVRLITRRALRCLGNVCRISKKFSSPVPLLKLYVAICIPQLQYASVAWNGISKSNSEFIERVQKNFYLYLSTVTIFTVRFLILTYP